MYCFFLSNIIKEHVVTPYRPRKKQQQTGESSNEPQGSFDNNTSIGFLDGVLVSSPAPIDSIIHRQVIIVLNDKQLHSIHLLRVRINAWTILPQQQSILTSKVVGDVTKIGGDGVCYEWLFWLLLVNATSKSSGNVINPFLPRPLPIAPVHPTKALEVLQSEPKSKKSLEDIENIDPTNKVIEIPDSLTNERKRISQSNDDAIGTSGLQEVTADDPIVQSHDHGLRQR